MAEHTSKRKPSNMSDIRRLLEKIDSMGSAEKHPTGPKFPGYWKGKDPASKSKTKMVGGAEESIIKELDATGKQKVTEWALAEAWKRFKEAETYTGIDPIVRQRMGMQPATQDEIRSYLDKNPPVIKTGSGEPLKTATGQNVQSGGQVDVARAADLASPDRAQDVAKEPGVIRQQPATPAEPPQQNVVVTPVAARPDTSPVTTTPPAPQQPAPAAAPPATVTRAPAKAPAAKAPARTPAATPNAASKEKLKMPDYIVGQIPGVESGNNPAAVSPKGALGAWQVMPATLKDPGYGVTPARDSSPEEISRVGRDYAHAMYNKYGGDTEKALAAYNAGPGRVDKAIKAAAEKGGNWKDYIPGETQKYLPKFNLAQPANAATAAKSAPAASASSAEFVPTRQGPESPVVPRRPAQRRAAPPGPTPGSTPATLPYQSDAEAQRLGLNKKPTPVKKPSPYVTGDAGFFRESNNKKIAGRYDPTEFDAKVKRVGILAKKGELKTVWDPETRRYKLVPVKQKVDEYGNAQDPNSQTTSPPDPRSSPGSQMSQQQALDKAELEQNVDVATAKSTASGLANVLGPKVDSNKIASGVTKISDAKPLTADEQMAISQLTPLVAKAAETPQTAMTLKTALSQAAMLAKRGK